MKQNAIDSEKQLYLVRNGDKSLFFFIFKYFLYY